MSGRDLLFASFALLLTSAAANSCYNDAGDLVDASDCPGNCCIGDDCGTEKECSTAMVVGVFIILLCVGGCVAGICGIIYCCRRRQPTYTYVQHPYPQPHLAQPYATSQAVDVAPVQGVPTTGTAGQQPQQQQETSDRAPLVNSAYPPPQYTA